MTKFYQVGGPDGVAYPESNPTAKEFGRPVVVIDPEDREAVERLTDLYWETVNEEAIADLQAALREFANPEPPKPDEPMRPGAIIKDADGVRWVSWRQDSCGHSRPWQRLEMDTDEYRDYKDISATEVLYEGDSAE